MALSPLRTGGKPGRQGAELSLQDPNLLTPTLVSAPELNPEMLFSARDFCFMLEVDVCREVVAVLRGSSSPVFVAHGEGLARKFMVSVTSPFLLHVSPEAMKSILSDFLPAANAACTLRRFVHSVLRTPRAPFGPSVQAFAGAVHRRLENHEQKLDEADILCQRGRKFTPAKQELRVATLTTLRDLLKRDLEELFFLEQILRRTGVIEQMASTESKAKNWRALITARLLSELFEALCETGMTGEAFRTSLLMNLFQAAATPYFEGIATWIENGDLNDADDDGNSELFMARDPQISLSSPEFWEGTFGFRVQESQGDPAIVHVLVPSFLDFAKGAILAAGRDAGILRILSERKHTTDSPILESSKRPKVDQFDGASWLSWVRRAMFRRTLVFDCQFAVRTPISGHPAVFSAHLPLFQYDQQPACVLENPASPWHTSEDSTGAEAASSPTLREMHDVILASIAGIPSKSTTLLRMILNDPPWSLNRRLSALAGVCLARWGEVFDNFVDTLVDSFTPPRAPCATSPAVLTAAFNSALKMGAAASCPRAGLEAEEGLWRVEFDDKTLVSAGKCEIDELQGMKMFWSVKINYSLPQPLPALIRWRVLDRYYLVVRLLLRLRATRRMLAVCAQERSEQFRLKCRFGADSVADTSSLAPIRDRTLHQMEMAVRFALSRFTAGWEAFLLRDVCDAEQRWLQETVEAARDVMDLRAALDNFGSAIARKALILPEAAPLLRLLIAVIDLVPELVNLLKWHTRQLAAARESSSSVSDDAIFARCESSLHGHLRDLAEKLERRRRRAVDGLAKVGEQAGYAGLEALALLL